MGRFYFYMIKFLLFLCLGLVPVSTVYSQSNRKNQKNKKEFQSLLLEGTVEQFGSEISESHITQKGGLIFINVTIDGNQYTFIFDTGAMITSISEEVAGTNTSDKEAIITDGFGNDSKKKIVKKNLELNGIIFKNISIAIIDFSHIEKQVCLKIDGILGLNAINLLNWKIDPEKSVISYSTKPFTSNFNSANFDIAFYSDILPLVEVSIHNHKFWALIDFGFAGYLTISHDVLEKLQEVKKIDTRKGKGSLFLTVTSQPKDENYLMNIDSLFINSHLYKEIKTIVASNKPALGSKFFSSTVTILNFTEKKMHVEIEVRKTRSPIEELSVKFCLNTNNEITVCFLWDDTQLERDGVTLGDKIISINGEPIDKVNSTKWCQFREQIAKGEELDVIIKSKSATNKYKYSQLKL